ncbi:hypothetical protein GW17_00030309, partial [Ensete ventricosum]
MEWQREWGKRGLTDARSVTGDRSVFSPSFLFLLHLLLGSNSRGGFLIFTRCQGDRCVVNRGEGLTTVDFSGGDAATAGAIGRSEGQREKRAVVDLLS